MGYQLKNRFIDYLDFYWSEIRGFFKSIKRKCNKDQKNLVKTAYQFEPWDPIYLLEVEQAAIIRMMNYHKTHCFVEGWETIVRDMQLCISLLDLMIDEASRYIICDGNITFGDVSANHYKFNKYVNASNAKRFLPTEVLEKAALNSFEDCFVQQELYLRKVRHLYHKIRYDKDMTWWD